MIISATYDPADDKIRISASAKLDTETYQRVKALGYGWAPKQEVFYAVWSPAREDLALELSGQDDLEDESTTLAERAEARADRFDGYSERRAADADGARRQVEQVSKRFEFGQPILVGHHSERKARKDAERIQSGMAKAVKMWKTSTYWTGRAAAALAHAEYKELPAVRARRIKTLEAELRGYQRAIAKAEATVKAWSQEGLTKAQALALANMNHFSRRFPLAEFPRQPPASQYEGDMSLWSALEDGIVDEKWAAASVLANAGRTLDPESSTNRWIEHLTNRIAYERTMLGESGWTPPPKPKTKSDLPILNYSGEVAYLYGRDVVREPAIGVTKAELAKVDPSYKGTRLSECRTHRIRIVCNSPLRRIMAARGAAAVEVSGVGYGQSAVYLTDSKKHDKPGAEEAKMRADHHAREVDRAAREELARLEQRAADRAATAPARAERDAAAAPFKAIEQSMKAGVTVVSAPQLFPTPAPLAARMVEIADIGPGMRVLEPSAGTGRILEAIGDAEQARTGGGQAAEVVAVEINASVAHALPRHLAVTVVVEDFLSTSVGVSGGGMALARFDRVVMNPPFVRGADIAHILHAHTFLKPDGRLVALCADGPGRREAFAPLIEECGGSYRPLPPGSFRSEGTDVRVAMVVINGRG
jgi:methylase of polypeptide subunit release factors